MQLAFSIAAHRNPSQLTRLLSAVYTSDDLYVIHVDARASDTRQTAEAFARDGRPNVHVIESRRVIWGGWSQTRVQLALMREALHPTRSAGAAATSWDYLINLSGQDYPLRTTEQIRAWLSERGTGRNFFEVLDFEQATPQIRPRMDFYHFEIGGRLRRVRLRRHHPRNLHIHWGSSWFIASRALCELATKGPLTARCRKAIRLARSSDEIFFQTLLMNGSLRETVVPDARRKIVWDGGSHPRTFTLGDAPMLLSADAFFARKFDEAVDANILDLIDRKLLGRLSPARDGATTAPAPATPESSHALDPLHDIDPEDLGIEPA